VSARLAFFWANRAKAKASVLEKGPQQIRPLLQPAEFRRYSLTQFAQVLRGVVGQPIVFDMGPHVINWVQLRGIWWKWLHN